MDKSKVYFSDFRTDASGDSLPIKLQKLIMASGIDSIDFEGKFVAIKMHFGEQGNVAYLRPNYAKAVVDVVKSLGGKPFLTDCNTRYPGSRKNAIEHLYCAWENGFTPLSAGCPIIIGDGIKGTDDISVPISGGVLCKDAKIGRAIMDADVFISLTHFKGHDLAGVGGCLKNIGMGCGSRAGKKEQHTSGQALIHEEKCRGCRKCQKECANGGLVYNSEKKKMTIDTSQCIGCGRCLGACNFDAIYFINRDANEMLCRRIAEYSKAVVDGRPNFHISMVMDVSPNCDCHPGNDVPIIQDIGMFASFDPVALDQACADACSKASPLPKTLLTDILGLEGCKCCSDYFKAVSNGTNWSVCLEHAEAIGLGSRDYEIVHV